jgi:hypothetical protein
MKDYRDEAAPRPLIGAARQGFADVLAIKNAFLDTFHEHIFPRSTMIEVVTSNGVATPNPMSVDTSWLLDVCFRLSFQSANILHNRAYDGSDALRS